MPSDKAHCQVAYPSARTKKSGSKPGMHRGPGSSKLNRYWAFIKAEREANSSFRKILKLLKERYGVEASTDTLHSFWKARNSRRNQVFSATDKYPGGSPRDGLKMEKSQDAFEAARKQALDNNARKNNRSKNIDESSVYLL
jgi:hypothetical protein